MKRRRFISTVIACLLAAPLSGVARQAPAGKGTGTINIPFEQYTLPNGLTVVISPDRSTPTVAVQVWYHVGSKNEEVGRTGFAHLFEHVMFTGSGHIPYGLHDNLTEGIGGSNNGTTDNDRTNYFQTVPSNYLETMLWLESDRMGFLLDALDIEKLNAQRDIVKNERRQGVDNQPYGRAWEILAEHTYPKGHPYSWSVIGSMDDLSAASEEDVKNFFRLYYAPNNAYLGIVGDFDPAQAKQWVEKYFGGIPQGKPVPRPTVGPVKLDAERRLVYEDRVPLPRLYVLWPSVGGKHDDVFALQVLGSILSGPRTARLTKELVFDRQIAASVAAGQNANEDAGDFILIVNPRPGNSLTDLEAAADAVIARLKAEGPTADEIEAATAGIELSFLRGLESNLGKSTQLLNGAGYHGDPGYFRTAYTKTRAVTADDVKRVANTYLTGGRVVLSVVPEGQRELAAKPDASKKVGGEQGLLAVAPGAVAQDQGPFDRTKIPAPGKPPELRVPSWTKAKLDNGAELVVSERHDLPLVSFTITFIGGANQYEPAGKRGTASFTAALLSEGTKTRDAEGISLALQLLGTSIGTAVGGESGAMSFVSTTASFQPTLEILADLLINPTFPEQGLERLRAQRLVALTQANAQPGSVNARVFSRVLYGEAHPYGQRADEASLEAISRDDLAAFHRAYFQPGRAIVTVVGDVDPRTLKTTLDKALAAWPAGGERPAFTYPAAPQPQKRTIYLVDMPGSAQSVFALGHPGPSRDTPDFFALQVMNTMLGGMFQSRLNANIREEKGYSYGVRSGFDYGKGPGPFSAGGDIVTDKSDAALQEFMKELRGIQGERPITDEELDMAKNSIIQRLPGQFGAVAQINGAITTLYVQGLPEDYYQNYAKHISAVGRDDVLRVAKQYIDLDRMAIVIVGDQSVIEGPLKAAGVAPIVHLDKEGKPITP